MQAQDTQGMQDTQAQDDGVVNFFAVDRGYGFLKTRTSGDVFFHVTNVAEGRHKLVVGAKVKFTLMPPRRLGQKHQATNIRVVEDASCFVEGFVSQEGGQGEVAQ